MNSNRVYHYNFSLIRLVACIMVLMVHLGERISLPDMLRPFFEAGSSGVTLFFVLTGFLSMESLEHSMAKGEKLTKWYLKKIIRILPVYYIAILAYFIVFQFVLNSVPTDDTGLYWFRYVFCIYGIVPTRQVFWSNLGAVWTVSVFLIWYIASPLIKKCVRGIWTSVVGFVLFYVLEKALNQLGGWGSSLKYLQYCMLGVVLFYFVRAGKEKILAAISIVLLYALIIKGSDSALVPAIVTIVFACVTMEIVVKNIVLQRVLAFSDRYSYGIYIMQGLAFLTIDLVPITNEALVVIVALFLTIGLAMACYYLIERPLNKMVLKR